jgi:pseudaminic acid synthase
MDKKHGENQQVSIVAEISANHGQDFDRAVAMIKKAKECGVDAVKFQAYTPDTITLDVDNRYFRVRHPQWGGQTFYQLYKKAYTPWVWFKRLKKVADRLGLLFFATAFDKTSVDFLEELNVRVHKISSFELVDLPLVEHAARTKKPLIISTGMGSLLEIREAVKTAKNAGAKEITLLKCVSSYPARPEDMNLTTITDMKKRFRCPVGLSDHTPGDTVAVAAVALGAVLIEKHFTLSRSIKTPDSFFSLEPDELKELVDHVRVAQKAMGKVQYGMTKKEKDSRASRRSLFAARDIGKGDIFSEENIRSVRPAAGLEPKYFKDVLGREAKRDIKKGTPLSWKLVLR